MYLTSTRCLNSLEIAQLMERWQQLIDVVFETAKVKCVFIHSPETPEICSRSASTLNSAAHCATGIQQLMLNRYCTKLMPRRLELIYDANPLYTTGFQHYCGVPISWPDGDLFAVLCLLDAVSSTELPKIKIVLEQLQRAVEYELAFIDKQYQLEKCIRNDEQRLLDVFSRIQDKVVQKANAHASMLQTRLFALLTTQYQIWHQALESRFIEHADDDPRLLKMSSLVRSWSNLLAIAKQIEWCNYPLEPALADITPVLEKGVFQTSLTLHSEVELISHLPPHLYWPCLEQLISLVGLAVASFLLVGQCQPDLSLFLTKRASLPDQLIIEWSLLRNDQLLSFMQTNENDAFLCFATACAEIARGHIEVNDSHKQVRLTLNCAK